VPISLPFSTVSRLILLARRTSASALKIEQCQAMVLATCKMRLCRIFNHFIRNIITYWLQNKTERQMARNNIKLLRFGEKQVGVNILLQEKTNCYLRQPEKDRLPLKKLQ
jgi:hypothetical protein